MKDSFELNQKDRSNPKTQIFLEVWDSSQGPTLPDNLMKEPGPTFLALKKARGGNTGHIALSIQKELETGSHALHSAATTLDRKPIIRRNEEGHLVKVQQQRFSFNPDADMTNILKTIIIGGSLTAFCADFAADCGYTVDDTFQEKLDKVSSTEEGQELLQAKKYMEQGKDIMQSLLKMTALQVQKQRNLDNPKAIIPLLTKLIEAVIPDKGSNTMTVFKAARQTLLDNITTELLINLQKIRNTESFAFNIGSYPSFEAWWEQNKDSKIVQSFCENYVSKPIFNCMEQLLKSDSANQEFIIKTMNHLAELEFAKRTPFKINLTYLNRYMDADQLQALMVDALTNGYNLKDNTCIQATLNIVLKGLKQSDNPEAGELLEALEGKYVKKDKDGQYKINPSIVNTPKSAYVFTQKLESCYRQIREKHQLAEEPKFNPGLST